MVEFQGYYLYLINIFHMSRTGQTFFCWYFIAVSLVGVSSGGCECFGDSRVQWKRSRIGYCSGCSHWFGDCAHIPADALCHLCEGMFISAGILHFRTLTVLYPKSRIGQYFSEIALMEQPIFVKLSVLRNAVVRMKRNLLWKGELKDWTVFLWTSVLG